MANFRVEPGSVTLPLKSPVEGTKLTLSLFGLSLSSLLSGVIVTRFVKGPIKFPPSKLIVPVVRSMIGFVRVAGGM